MAAEIKNRTGPSPVPTRDASRINVGSNAQQMKTGGGGGGCC